MPALYPRENKPSKGLGGSIRRRRLILFIILLVGILFFAFVPWELPSSLKGLGLEGISRANVAQLIKSKKVDEIYGLLHLVTGDHEQEHVLSNAVHLDPTLPIELSVYAAGDTALNWTTERDTINENYPIVVFSKVSKTDYYVQTFRPYPSASNRHTAREFPSLVTPCANH